MIINLAKVEFINDMFSLMLPDGSTLVLNKVNESFTATGYIGELPVKTINIEIDKADNDKISCPCVIGLGNDLMHIDTDYTEYEGKVLTPENMVYCTIEIYE